MKNCLNSDLYSQVIFFGRKGLTSRTFVSPWSENGFNSTFYRALYKVFSSLLIYTESRTVQKIFCMENTRMLMYTFVADFFYYHSEWHSCSIKFCVEIWIIKWSERLLSCSLGRLSTHIHNDVIRISKIKILNARKRQILYFYIHTEWLVYCSVMLIAKTVTSVMETFIRWNCSIATSTFIDNRSRCATLSLNSRARLVWQTSLFLLRLRPDESVAPHCLILHSISISMTQFLK